MSFQILPDQYTRSNADFHPPNSSCIAVAPRTLRCLQNHLLTFLLEMQASHQLDEKPVMIFYVNI